MRILQSSKLFWFNGERPHNSGHFLVTVMVNGKRKTFSAYYNSSRKTFDCAQTVLAWARLPAPYGDKIFDKRSVELWPTESTFGEEAKRNRPPENAEGGDSHAS